MPHKVVFNWRRLTWEIWIKPRKRWVIRRSFFNETDALNYAANLLKGPQP